MTSLPPYMFQTTEEAIDISFTFPKQALQPYKIKNTPYH